jgi:hypothetical protein
MPGESFQSRADGVTQLARHTIAAKSAPRLRMASLIPPSVLRTPLSASAAVGVGQLANCAAIPRVRPNPLFPCCFAHASRRACHFVSVSFCGPAFGVGHEPQPLSDVRGTDAVCAQNGCPDAVALAFHVCLNKVEPLVPNRCCNLLAKNVLRSALLDEMKPGRPEMPLICKPIAATCRAERLARA